ncbi:hypothetical protein AVEN_178828-1 [Araneus ventricosus]|uniref:Uncharacterized protein n=1 Tax=Araneus ventricosus TaxID=182803 RepID=A0A4Y2BDP7_ARAVE|nr:hypothetical protein AVEN_178828-1 [Araneus ventricosus]
MAGGRAATRHPSFPPYEKLIVPITDSPDPLMGHRWLITGREWPTRPDIDQDGCRGCTIWRVYIRSWARFSLHIVSFVSAPAGRGGVVPVG